jgi:hypothetical protein
VELPGHRGGRSGGPVGCWQASCAHRRTMRSLLLGVLLAGLLVAGLPADLARGDGPGDPVGTVVRVLTAPDIGEGGATLRWRRPQVRVRFDLAGYPAWFIADGVATLQWAAEVTGLAVVVVDSGEADLVVAPRGDRGALVRVRSSHGEIIAAEVEVGCCRPRALREDLLQAFGPLGDHAPRGSLFSQDLSAEDPSPFDRWALEVLYALPPGSSAAAVRRCSELTALRSWSARGTPPVVACPLG